MKAIMYWCGVSTGLLVAALFVKSLSGPPQGILIMLGLVAACLGLLFRMFRA